LSSKGNSAAPVAPDPVDERADAWAALGRFSTTAIGGAYGVAIRRDVLRQYVRFYLRAHGYFPTGRQMALGSHRNHPIRFEVRFPGKAFSALAAFGHRLAREEVWGPYPSDREHAFVRTRRDYWQSPERARVRAWLVEAIKTALNGPISGSSTTK
jgi:hypothetical protein